jgi:hypothetical protein
LLKNDPLGFSVLSSPFFGLRPSDNHPSGKSIGAPQGLTVIVKQASRSSIQIFYNYFSVLKSKRARGLKKREARADNGFGGCVERKT